jgi:hypothetical protein
MNYEVGNVYRAAHYLVSFNCCSESESNRKAYAPPAIADERRDAVAYNAHQTASANAICASASPMNVSRRAITSPP